MGSGNHSAVLQTHQSRTVQAQGPANSLRGNWTSGETHLRLSDLKRFHWSPWEGHRIASQSPHVHFSCRLEIQAVRDTMLHMKWLLGLNVCKRRAVVGMINDVWNPVVASNLHLHLIRNTKFGLVTKQSVVYNHRSDCSLLWATNLDTDLAKHIIIHVRQVHARR